MVTVPIGTITLAATGYVDISPYTPTLQSGERVITAGVSYWGTMNPAGGFTVTEDGKYLYGSPNQTITNLTVRYVIGRVPIN